MNIKLLHFSPLWLASHACRMSHDNHDKSDTVMKHHSLIVNDMDDDEYGYCTADYGLYGICGEKDKALIERVGNKFKHQSILEQLVYWFDIDGIPRYVLQELVRHRTSRLTSKSSRYTVSEIKNEKPFCTFK